MTKEEHIRFIEGKIQQCVDVQDMEMEKWAFIQCLKNARKLGQELPVHSVSNSLAADIRNKLSSPKNLCAMLQDREIEPFIEQERNDMVAKELEQTLKSIEYLSSLCLLT